MRKHLICGILIVLGLVIRIQSASAQPLADRVPADAIVYAGWAGSDAVPAGYNTTHLKAIVDNSKINEFLTEFLPRLGDRLVASDRNARQPVELAKAVWASVWKHPTAFFFAGMDMSNPRQPMPKLGLICKAGADAAAIQQQLRQLMGPGANPLSIAQVEDLLVLTVGYGNANQLLNGGGALKGAAAFGASMKQVQSDPMLAAYVDFEKVITLIQTNVASGDPQTAAMFPRILESLGLNNLKRATMTAGFDGADWMSQCFVEMPGPRTGLLEAFSNQPLSPELLKSIPADATFVSVGRFDPAKLIAAIRNTAGQVSPQAQRLVDQGLSAVQVAIARNLVTDILEPLGQDWAIYCSPSAAGTGALGLVMVNHLDDPAKAAMSLPIAWTNLSNWANVALKRNRVDVQVTGQMTDIDGAKVYYAGIPILAPAWTIKEGNLYLGLYPQSAAAATNANTRAGGKSILENEKFTALQKRLGGNNPIGFSFMDLPNDVRTGSMYQKLLVVGRYAGFSDLFGVPLPEPLLPPLGVLQQHVIPAGAFGWSDDAGYHVKSVSAFPGSEVLSEPVMISSSGPASAAIMASILLPSLNRARETANRVKCAANLKGLGNSLLLYANDHQGKYPPDLATLASYLDANGMAGRGQIFICPSSSNSIPPNIAQMAPDQYAAWVNDNSSYVYIGGALNIRAGAEQIVFYEKPDDHNGDGMNMLYGDGHVDWSPMAQAMQMIQRQQAK